MVVIIASGYSFQRREAVSKNVVLWPTVFKDGIYASNYVSAVEHTVDSSIAYNHCVGFTNSYYNNNI